MIVLRTPKGWTGPKVVDGKPIEGTFRSHQVPLSNPSENPEHLKQLEAWMRSYKPEELFDAGGQLEPRTAGPGPEGRRRMGANPHANGGAAAEGPAPARFPRLCGRRSRARRGESPKTRACWAISCAMSSSCNPGPAQFPHLRPGRDALQSAGRGV